MDKKLLDSIKSWLDDFDYMEAGGVIVDRPNLSADAYDLLTKVINENL